MASNAEQEMICVIHPGPDMDKAMEDMVRAWTQIVIDQIDAMHLSVSEVKQLRKSFGFDD